MVTGEFYGSILWLFSGERVCIFPGKDKVWKMGVENYGCDDPGITIRVDSFPPHQGLNLL